jgi:hydrogenase maturation protease
MKPSADPKEAFISGTGFHREMAEPVPQELDLGGEVLRPGIRVRLQPKYGGDFLEKALTGRFGVVDEIIQDDSGQFHVAVRIENFPGFDLGRAGHPAHRFFFDRSELHPVAVEKEIEVKGRVLVAGIGNVFLGDDGFGVEVAKRLLTKNLPADVDVADFGIRGMDLAYTLGRGYHAAILIDAVPAGLPPGTLVILKPDESERDAGGRLDPHRMDPISVLELAGRLGPLPERVFVVGCQPGSSNAPEETYGLLMELSAPVAASVEKAAEIVSAIVDCLLETPDKEISCG